MTTPSADVPRPTIFGHPTGLFMLFFAEMWERFSYYGMRALLVLYMIKGFLEYEDKDAYTVYGAYTALVYMTPFFGGLIADRLLGARRAVVVGGLLMAAGHLIMGIEATWPFFTALALLIVGNGFFKPNISTIVGNLYPDGDPRRDGGFTLFYMGINLGAAAAPLLCGYIGETYGWHYGFGLATIGMLVGLAIFVMPSIYARYLTLAGAAATALSMVLIQEDVLLLAVNGFVALCLGIAGVISFIAMGREGMRPEDGAPPEPELLRKGVIGPITWEHITYLGTALAVPLLALLVWANLNVEIIPEEITKQLAESGDMMTVLAGSLLHEIARPAGLLLLIVGIIAVGYLVFEAVRSPKVERERLFVVLILMFFSMLFWAFFEQAGSSVNNFTDRNVDRITEERVITPDDVGTQVTLRLNQEQLGYAQGGKVFTMDQLDDLKKPKKQDGEDAPPEKGIGELITEAFSTPPPLIRMLSGMESEEEVDDPLVATWEIDESHVGMGVNGTEVPASTFQAANPIFILLFGLPFASLWVFLGKRGIEPNTSIKFALGLLQLGLGFMALWYGASLAATDRGMVWMGWLLLGYLLHTTGELCLSPVGLSMVTRLSPKRLVSTVMGGWFLATAFSAYLAAVIATFTSPPKKKAEETADAGAAGDDGAADAGSASVDEPAAATPAAPIVVDPAPEVDGSVPPKPAVETMAVGTPGTVPIGTLGTDNDGSVDEMAGGDPGDLSGLMADTDAPVAAPAADTDAPVAASAVDTDAPAIDAAATASTSSPATETAAPSVGDETADADLVATTEAREPVPPPVETAPVYGGVFFNIAMAAIASAVLLAAISPVLQKWMHQDAATGKGQI